MPRTSARPRAAVLSAAEARRIALAAQGFTDVRDGTAVANRRLLGMVERLGLLQIDSVNVLVRAHYLPLFSRLGPYDTARLDGAAYGRRPRRLFEYWGHEASLLPVGLQPFLRWRMARAERGVGIYAGLARFGRRRRAYIESVLDEIAERGPLAASELRHGGRGRGPWWGWSDGKRALEWLFWTGRVTTAARRRFERVYDLPARVLPPDVLATPTPSEAEAQRTLLRRAATALGVATARDLADYFRLRGADARARLTEMVEARELERVQVEGWSEAAYLAPSARLPREVTARALVAPFDPLVWDRRRAERVFGFRYRIEIYTPAHLRAHGYYVLPFLLGDRLVARVDLKADRAASVLRVLATHGEPAVPAGRVAAALVDELENMATWLRLDRIEIAPRGDLGAVVERAARRRR